MKKQRIPAALRLLEIMAELKKNGTQLAKGLDLPQTTISGSLNANKEVSERLVLRLQSVYSVNPDFIYYGTLPKFLKKPEPTEALAATLIDNMAVYPGAVFVIRSESGKVEAYRDMSGANLARLMGDDTDFIVIVKRP